MTKSNPIAESANDEGGAGHHKRLLAARITFLEMHAPLKKGFALPSSPKIALMKADNVPSAFFRFLFEEVGKPHHWQLCRSMDEVELDKFINGDDTELQVLYCDGCPAGFFLLDLSEKPKTVELSLFGLMPDYQGLALGKWFLAAAINAAWYHEPEYVRTQTNSLDHAAALGLYQKLGFSPFGYREEMVEAWD